MRERGQRNEALRLLNAMRRYGLSPNVISFSAAISACEKGGHWHEAVRLLSVMSWEDLSPDVISFSADISACEKGGQWNEALRLLKTMCGYGRRGCRLT